RRRVECASLTRMSVAECLAFPPKTANAACQSGAHAVSLKRETLIEAGRFFRTVQYRTSQSPRSRRTVTKGRLHIVKIRDKLGAFLPRGGKIVPIVLEKSLL